MASVPQSASARAFTLPITLYHRWQECLEAMRHPAFELDSDEFAFIHSTYEALRQTGRDFGPEFDALMGVLFRQLRDSESAVEDHDDELDNDHEGNGIF